MRVCLVLGSVFFALLICEVGYRAFYYNKLRQKRFQYLVTEVPISQFDAKVGFRYRADLNLNVYVVGKSGEILKSNAVEFNNFGHVSPEPDELDKPPDEFRIAVLGDSFTASIYNDHPWTYLLQQKLNEDKKLKRKLQKKSIKVINFGRDTVGISTMGLIYEQEVRRFHPDMVLINFIGNDVYRRLLWKGVYRPVHSSTDPKFNYTLTLVCSKLPVSIDNPACNPESAISMDLKHLAKRSDLQQIQKQIVESRISQLGFLKPSLFLLSRLVHPNRRMYQFEMRRQFLFEFVPPNLGLKHTERIFNQIRRELPLSLFVHNPLPEELENRTISPGVSYLLQKGEYPLFTMLDSMSYLSVNQIRRVFNHPYDSHFSNHGAHYYANLMATLIKRKLHSARHSKLQRGWNGLPLPN